MVNTVSLPAGAETCPLCGHKARPVQPLTVRALVQPELAHQVREEPYRFCAASGCEVVYFSERDPKHRFVLTDLRVPVGQKATQPPFPVCYCFDWTTEDLACELQLRGTTTIPDRIKRLVQLGFCRCETMNPQGTCCLGNVHRAVKQLQTMIQQAPPAAMSAELASGGNSGNIADLKSVSSLPSAPGRQRSAVLPLLGAILTALLGSACCWLPLLLMALGFSAAGMSSFFEPYRPYFLAATFALLGMAWYFTYRTTLRRLGTGLWSKLASAHAARATHTGVATPTTAHSCCADKTEPEPEECCAPGAKAGTGSTPLPKLRIRQLNQVLLWLATAVILLFVLFPQVSWWSRGQSPSAAVKHTETVQQLVLEIRGMHCAGCAAVVEKALRDVPGVSAVSVSYETSQAVVFIPKGQEVSREALLQAVRQAGYEAVFQEGTR
jgi:copper chaperone CopZ